MATPLKIGDSATLAAIEREHVLAVVAQTRTLGEAAKVLGVDVSTLHRKRKQWSAEPRTLRMKEAIA